MEDKIFTNSDGADFIGESSVVYYNATLVVDVGEHKAGTKFDGIMVDPDRGQIVLQNYKEDGTFMDEFKYELEYKIGAKID